MTLLNLISVNQPSDVTIFINAFNDYFVYPYTIGIIIIQTGIAIFIRFYFRIPIHGRTQFRFS